MKLRGVERATAEAVDMIPPPHHSLLSYQAEPSTQLSADAVGQGTTTQRMEDKDR